ncbi:MAG: two-component regulator propeller domain-containing protein [Opitutus sp.]
MSPFLRSFALPALFLLVLAIESDAATSLVDGYSVRAWQTDDGLPENMVTSPVQTRDGYLWFGTYSGLARFDGERFEVFDSINSPGLRDRRVVRLFEDAQGTLWLGHDSGIVTLYRDGHFKQIALPSGGVGDKIIGLGSDEQSRRWAMRETAPWTPSKTGLVCPRCWAMPGLESWLGRVERRGISG